MKTTELHKRYFIAEQKLIDQYENQFDLVNRDETNWTATYMDKETGDVWLTNRLHQLACNGLPPSGIIWYLRYQMHMLGTHNVHMHSRPKRHSCHMHEPLALSFK